MFSLTQSVWLSTDIVASFSICTPCLSLRTEKVGARGFDVRQDSSALSRSLTWCQTVELIINRVPYIMQPARLRWLQSHSHVHAPAKSCSLAERSRARSRRGGRARIHHLTAPNNSANASRQKTTATNSTSDAVTRLILAGDRISALESWMRALRTCSAVWVANWFLGNTQTRNWRLGKAVRTDFLRADRRVLCLLSTTIQAGDSQTKLIEMAPMTVGATTKLKYWI